MASKELAAFHHSRSLIAVAGRLPTTAFGFRLQFANRSPAPSGPSLFAALGEQLGVQLRSATAPVQVLVIDSVERPTPD